MKKILSLLLVLMVGVTLFTGCSEKSIKTNTQTTETKTELDGVITDANERVANQEQAKKDAIEEALESKSVEDDKKENSKRSPSYANIKGDIKEQVIYNENDIKITAKGFNFEKVDPKFMLEVENKRPDTVNFKIENVAINGFTLKASIPKEIYTNEKQEVPITFLDGSILANRIETIENLSFTINIEDGETKLTTDEIILKTGLTAEEYPEIANGQTVIDKNGVKVVYLDMKYGTEWTDTTLYLYIENNLPHEISINSYDREALINGKKVDISSGDNLPAYRKIISRITINDKKLAEKDISVIETFSLDDYWCINEEDKSITIFKNEPFVLENLSKTVITEE